MFDTFIAISSDPINSSCRESQHKVCLLYSTDSHAKQSRNSAGQVLNGSPSGRGMVWRGGRSTDIGKGTEDDLLHAALPVEPRKRYVYVVHSPGGPGLDCPVVVDQTGSYIRRDGLGGNYLCGRAPPTEVSSLEVFRSIPVSH